jgi:hypothetical protein
LPAESLTAGTPRTEWREHCARTRDLEEARKRCVSATSYGNCGLSPCDILSNCLQPDTQKCGRPSGGRLSGAAMILLGFYLLFLTVITIIGCLIGYLVDVSFPGSGTLVGVGIFMAAVWVAWVISVRVTERFWPEQPTT